MSKDNGKNPLMYLFGKLWHYSSHNRSKVILYSLMFIVSECINTFWTPLVLAKMMNIIEFEGITETSLKKLLFLLVLFPTRSVLTWAFHGPARILEEANAFHAKANYKQHLLEGVMNMPLEWHADHHSGDTIDKIEKSTTALYDFSSNSFCFIKPLVKFIGCFGMIVYFSNLSVFIVGGIVALGIYITVRFDRVIGPQGLELSRKENKIAESVFDSISNISTVIILRVEKLVFNSIMHKVREPFKLFNTNNKLEELKWSLTSICCAVMTVLVLSLYFYQHVGTAEKVSVASVYLVVSFLDKISDLFYEFTSLYSWTIKRKFRVLNGEELSRDFRKTSFTNHVLPNGWKELRLQNLNFAYQNGKETELHLDDVSMSILHGERIALVGETGSGKTTLLKIMRDLYHPKSLALTVDKKVIETGFEGISRAISLVPQSPEIFSTTILSNITLGAEHDEKKVKYFTDMACFTSVVGNLPKGLQSSIKEKGVNLSGGQVQRLALSRGLLASHDKDIVLLDEPTSSLDFVTEMKVYQNIFKGFAGKTVVSSVHRLHLLPLFDRIYMFEKGRIVGSGSVSALLESCPQFAELWQKQLEATV